MKKYLLVFNLFLILSCSEDDVRYSVDPALDAYVNTFISEAQERGVTIPKNNLIAELTDFKAQSIANGSIDGDQKFLYVHKGLFEYGTSSGKTALIEYSIFDALGGLFVSNSVNLGDLTKIESTYSREAYFDELIK